MRSFCALLGAIATFTCADTASAAGNTYTVPSEYAMEKNISYGPYPQNVLDVIQPKAPSIAKRPAVIVIHGGGWVEGAKETMLEHYVLPYLQQGFVVCNVEYRLASVAKAPAAVTDVLTAVSWFEQNAKQYNIDVKRVVVTGGSAGGHLALMAGMVNKSAHLGPVSRIAAVVNFYGITDVEDQLQGPNKRDYAVDWIPAGEEGQDIARRVSPMTYVRKDVPAILTIHGNADETVPYEHGVELTRALRKEGADAELIPVPDGKHGFTEAQLAQVYPQIWQFLRKRGILTNGK